MIVLIPAHQLNKEKYNSCIDRHEYPLIYGYSWYLDATNVDWSVLVYNDYELVWPIAHNSKWLLNYIYQPFGIQQLGIFGAQTIDVNVTRQFLQAATRHFQYFNVNFNYFNSLPNSIGSRYSFIENQTVFLQLNTSYESLYHSYSSNTIRNLKQFKKSGLEIRQLNNPSELISLFKNNQGEKFNHIKEGFYEVVERLMHEMLHKGIGQIRTIYGQYNELVAGIFFMNYKGRITLLFTAANEEGKSCQGMTGLIDDLILEYSNKNYLLDFEGSNHEGISRFYLGFGGYKEKYFTVKKQLPWPLNLVKR